VCTVSEAHANWAFWISISKCIFEVSYAVGCVKVHGGNEGALQVGLNLNIRLRQVVSSSYGRLTLEERVSFTKGRDSWVDPSCSNSSTSSSSGVPMGVRVWWNQNADVWYIYDSAIRTTHTKRFSHQSELHQALHGTGNRLPIALQWRLGYTSGKLFGACHQQ
jgi:hypothetical protein